MRDYEASSASPIESTLIRNFVRDAQAKLAQLQEHKERICSRMQALRYLSIHGHGTNRRNEAQSNSAFRKLNVSETAPRSATPTSPQPYSVDAQSKLRRACRIALLESGEPQSSREIYERIQKRGSMSFDGHENVPQILIAQLKTMAANSEISCVSVNGEMRWQWTPGQEI